MRSLILMLLMVAATYSQTPSIEPGVPQELARWRAARYSDVRYKLDLALEKKSPVLKGTIEARVNVRHGDASGPIILDWRKVRGFEDRSTVSNVSINGKAVVQSASFTSSSSTTPASLRSGTPPIQEGSFGSRTLNYEESNEHLIFRDGVVEGENVIKLDFTSPILPSGAAVTRYIDKEDGSEYVYSLFVPSDASTAFPVFDQPDLKARFTLQLRVPDDWRGISNSKWNGMISTGGCIYIPTGRPNAPGCSYTIGFDETEPISTYVFAFAAGPWSQVSQPGAAVTDAFARSSLETGGTTGGNPTGREGVNPQSEIRNPKSKNTLPTGRVSALTQDVSSTIYVRQSQLAKFKPHAAEVFRLNREAVKYFEDYFDYKFPFSKYDLVLIPEFPFGGMEHAGATFLREAGVIFPQEPTKNDIATRATLIFHEAAHQWFGDTVTMRWFDDLWLKEGFATFTAYKAMEKIMPEMNAWKIFYERIKQGAYQTDSTKGTTAIYQPIANLSAAKSAYGNIVYNKAPAVLRQAEFYLGEEKFRAAVRAFVRKNAFSNATWEDLINEFTLAADSLMVGEEAVVMPEADRRWLWNDWAKTWVTKPGLSKYYVTSRQVHLSQPYPGMPTISYQMSHKSLFDDSIQRKQQFQILLRSERRKVEVIDLYFGGVNVGGHTDGSLSKALFIGKHKVLNDLYRSQLIFPNYGDYGYGIFLLDAKSRDYVLKNIQNERDPFLRSMMWGALWDSVREGELDPRQYVELAIKNLPIEKDESVAAMILNRVGTAMTYYVSDQTRNVVGPRLEAMLLEKMRTASTLGQRITFYRAFLNVASSDSARRVLKEMLATTGGNPTGREGVKNAERGTRNAESNPKSKIENPKSESLPLKTKDRFDIVTKLLILNDPEAPKLLAELERKETSDDAKRYAYAAKAGIATAESKAKFWSDFTTNKEISESWIEAAFGPFNSVRHANLTLPYLERALKELPNHKRNRKIFFVNGWLGAFIGGQRSEEALAIVNKFLADNPNLDRDLRLKILENVDVIERAVKIRSKYAK